MRNLAWAAMILASTFIVDTAVAQTQCTETMRFDPPLKVLRCSDGLLLETERNATLSPVDRNGDGHLEGAELGGGAALVTLPSSARVRRDGFQILTPHALASVRGTVYAVDVTNARTAVFVERGRVVVARRSTPDSSVTLRPGEGVDVDAYQGPLEVRRWPQERVRGLLERFGR